MVTKGLASVDSKHTEFVFPNRPLGGAGIKASLVAFLITWALGLLLAVTLWMPGAAYDDSFFAGPAIHFARTGEMRSFLFETPFVAANSPPYWYTPIFVYFLGFWLKLFGCSTAAVLSFYATCAALASGAFSLVVSRFGCTSLWSGLSALIAWTTFYSASMFGIRPEVLSLTMAFSGLAALPSSRAVRSTGGFFLLALAAATAPRVAGWAATFAALATVGLFEADYRWNSALMRLVVGSALAFLVFAISIRFDWTEFWTLFGANFTANAALSFGESLTLASKFLTTGFGKINWLIPGLLAVVGCAVAPLVNGGRAVLPLLVALVTGIGLGLFFGGYGIIIFVYLGALSVWGILLPKMRVAAFSWGTLALIAGSAFVPLGVTATAFFQSMYLKDNLWNSYSEIRNALEGRNFREVWIDYYAIRYIFDFSPPPQSRSATQLLPEIAKNPIPTEDDIAYVIAQPILFEADQQRFENQGGSKVFGKVLYIRSEPNILLLRRGTAIPNDLIRR